MRYLSIFLTLFLSLQISGQTKNLYQFSAKTIDGETLDFVTLKGKKVLIVNTASECALTKQYKKLQELYEEYGGDDFEIIGFPANNFGMQEPGTNSEINSFCQKNYGVTFTIMEKISVKGDDIHPIYKWLTSIEENGVLDAKVTWNFQKFMIDENGNVVDFVSPIKSPKNRRIINWLNER